MAAMLRTSRVNTCCYLTLRRWAHTMLPPLDSATGSRFKAVSPPMVLPESEDENDNYTFSFIHGSMELMAVPKKKVSPHKRGIRNGPKALKPVPVIVRCTVCGRVKLPHFFCCSGIRPGGQNGSTS